MRFINKIRAFTVATSLLLCMSVQAADVTDAQSDASAQQNLQAVTQYAQSVDPEQGSAVLVNKSTTSTSTVGKISVTQDAISLNGLAVTPAGYNINDENYFKLRDIAYLLNGKANTFSVSYNTSTNTIAIVTGASYVADGSEMKSASSNPVVAATTAKVTVNGVATSITSYNINGNNYYRLRDIGAKVGFSVDYVNKVITLKSGTVASYAVTFQMDGKGTQVAQQSVIEGGKVTKPTTPTATGYVFSNWYRDSALTQVWDFTNSTVTANTTLYAKWSQLYTMTFDMNGHGTQIAAKTGIASGSFVTEPAKPTASGYTFGGWFIDAQGNTPWIFNVDAVFQNITVYAYWTESDTDDTTVTPPTNSGGTGSATAVDGVLTILVDPGHGGTDPGAGGNGMYENGLNLEVALYLQQMLAQSGVTVIMSRTDTATTLYGVDRKNFVLEQCKKGTIDLVVSIHHNAANGKASGAEVLIQSAAQNPSGTSKELGKLILSEYQKMGQSSRGTTDGSGKYMLSAPATHGVTAVLSEFCFLDNAADAAKIDTAAERKAEAQALYNAIMAFYKTNAY